MHAFSVGTFGGFGLTPFDPALGTLDSINVSISGVLSVLVTTQQNLVFNGTTFVPLPYTYGVTAEQRFIGEGGKYFRFDSPATFQLTGVATGAGEPGVLATTYSYSMTFNAVTDLIGLVIPSTSSTVGALIPPISGVVGPRSDFILGPPPVDAMDIVQSAVGTPLTGPPPTITGITSGGSLFMTYNYTPAAVADVPEPATLLLVAGGLVWAVRRRRR